MRRVALRRGGDWADASVDLLDVPDGVDLNAECVAWNRWYEQEYLDQSTDEQGQNTVPYIDFICWLKTRCGVVDNRDVEDFLA